MQLIKLLQALLNKTRAFDWLSPLALRIYLAPIFILAGMNKLSHVENVATWFEYMGIPAPELMVWVRRTYRVHRRHSADPRTRRPLDRRTAYVHDDCGCRNGALGKWLACTTGNRINCSLGMAHGFNKKMVSSVKKKQKSCLGNTETTIGSPVQARSRF